MKSPFISVLLAACVLAVSCVPNDLPYPLVQGAFASLEVEGATRVSVDAAARTVNIALSEAVPLESVRITGVTYVNGGTTCEPEILGTHNLSSPCRFTLKTWQEYKWMVSASQEIDRYFKVEGQIGAEFIDVPNRRIIAYVPARANLEDINVTDLKLGPDGISSYAPLPGQMKDFSEGVEVTVTYRGKQEVWWLYVEKKSVSVAVERVDPWTRRAKVIASGNIDAENGFRYRAEGASEWQETGASVRSRGVFSGFIEGLLPQTAYECKAYSGAEESAILRFETEAEEPLPNGGFETYSHAESSVFYSWFDPAASAPQLKTKWWDSGNVGSTTVGAAYSIALPDTEVKHQGNASAHLVSRNVIIKFAAGNTFAGEFVRVIGTQGGILNFGRPWTTRPTALRFWMKYNCGSIDVIDSYPPEYPVSKGDPDCCSIWAAVGDWDYRKYGGTSECPVQINTTQKDTFFNPEGDAVIAYGAFFADESSSASWAGKDMVIATDADGWVQVEIPLRYRDEDRKPTHIILSFASSRLGDYFTGSSSSQLWLDNLELVYN